MIVRLIAPAMIKYAITPTMINESAIKKLNQEGFHLGKDNDLFSVVINSENYTFRIYDNGILVFNYQMELPDVIPYQEVLTKKEEKTREIIDREGSVVQFLKTIELVIESIIPNIKESLFFNGKYVSYCLATYRVSPENKVTAYSLALKRPVKEDQIQSLNEQSLKVVTVKDNTQLLLIWGARVLIGDDELSLNLYDDYVKNESEAQYLWFIITSLDKRIDSYMLNETGRAADLSLLLDTSYSVLYRKSKFDGVVSSKSHRYEIEIFNSIISASKIDYLYDNLEKKIRLLKEKSSLIEEEIDKKNRKFVNILLGIISLLSAISTIYGFVSVFQDGDKKTTYIIVTVVAVVLFGAANLLQYLGKRKLVGKKRKKKK